MLTIHFTFFRVCSVVTIGYGLKGNTSAMHSLFFFEFTQIFLFFDVSIFPIFSKII